MSIQTLYYSSLCAFLDINQLVFLGGEYEMCFLGFFLLFIQKHHSQTAIFYERYVFVNNCTGLCNVFRYGF